MFAPNNSATRPNRWTKYDRVSEIAAEMSDLQILWSAGNLRQTPVSNGIERIPDLATGRTDCGWPPACYRTEDPPSKGADRSKPPAWLPPRHPLATQTARLRSSILTPRNRFQAKRELPTTSSAQFLSPRKEISCNESQTSGRLSKLMAPNKVGERFRGKTVRGVVRLSAAG